MNVVQHENSTIRCKVCQVETERRIRCGALVCEACKRFFMRHRRLDAKSALICRNGSGQCLENSHFQSRITRRGWVWRDLCAGCRFEKCLKVGMGRSASVPNTMAMDNVEPNKQPQSIPAPSFNYNLVLEICEQMKREKQIEHLQQQQQQQEQLIALILANQFLNQ